MLLKPGPSGYHMASQLLKRLSNREVILNGGAPTCFQHLPSQEIWTRWAGPQAKANQGKASVPTHPRIPGQLRQERMSFFYWQFPGDTLASEGFRIRLHSAARYLQPDLYKRQNMEEEAAGAPPGL